MPATPALAFFLFHFSLMRVNATGRLMSVNQWTIYGCKTIQTMGTWGDRLLITCTTAGPTCTEECCHWMLLQIVILWIRYLWSSRELKRVPFQKMLGMKRQKGNKWSMWSMVLGHISVMKRPDYWKMDRAGHEWSCFVCMVQTLCPEFSVQIQCSDWQIFDRSKLNRFSLFIYWKSDVLKKRQTTWMHHVLYYYYINDQ